MIISNTTLDRSDLKTIRNRDEAGGLSGKPLFEKSTIVLAHMRARLGNDLPIIGVGGISSPEQAIAKLEAGANLVQIYSGLVYKGPGLAAAILKGLKRHLDVSGIAHISELSGTKTQDWCEKWSA